MDFKKITEQAIMFHEQNLNGRESDDELFEAGIKAGLMEAYEEICQIIEENKTLIAILKKHGILHIFKSQPVTMQTNLTFGEALEAVKQGKLISREGWNGKGMFVFERPADKLDPLFILKVKSLPEAYKETLKNVTFQAGEQITFTAYLCMKAADNSVVNGWLASQTDMLANDWCIL